MDFDRIRYKINEWYGVQKRELPWRETKDPYLIWISEIILQQTRVDQGLGYYLRFTERFPTVKSLAEAEESEVLKVWQGLGYYSRARNIHSSARTIQSDFNGVFPSTYDGVRRLKGVGDYTAAAICSFAYGMAYAAVDGNIYRVLSRLYGIAEPIDSGAGKRQFAGLAQELLSKTNPGEHNQAMMEFGALQCVPRNPNCTECVLSEYCVAFASGIVDELPVKKTRAVVKNRYFNYFIIKFEDAIYLQKREANDIWRNMYELPLIETSEAVTFDQLSQTEQFSAIFAGINHIDATLEVKELVHVLSHRRIITTCYSIVVSNESLFLSNCIRVYSADIEKYAVSRLTSLLLEKSYS